MSESNGVARRKGGVENGRRRGVGGESGRGDSPQMVDRWGRGGELAVDSPPGDDAALEVVDVVQRLYARVEVALQELTAVKEELGEVKERMKDEGGRMKAEG